MNGANERAIAQHVDIESANGRGFVAAEFVQVNGMTWKYVPCADPLQPGKSHVLCAFCGHLLLLKSRAHQDAHLRSKHREQSVNVSGFWQVTMMFEGIIAASVPWDQQRLAREIAEADKRDAEESANLLAWHKARNP